MQPCRCLLLASLLCTTPLAAVAEASDADYSRRCAVGLSKPDTRAPADPGCSKAQPVDDGNTPVRITVGKAIDWGPTSRPSQAEQAAEGRTYLLDPRSNAGTVRLLTKASDTLATRIRGIPSGIPLQARSISSQFGLRRHPLLGISRLHAGIDLRAVQGTPVRATASGLVSMAGVNGGYGIFVAIDHGNGVESRYAHLSRLYVRQGQTIIKGDVIGLVGSTGLSTGPHLHYEIRKDGRALDPSASLQGK